MENTPMTPSSPTPVHLDTLAVRALRAVLTWADQRCPCHNDEPNPCPLCGASVENLEACKSAENTIPRTLLADIRMALSEVGGRHG